jgi:glycosyltransferase involved in cell wall biosynthesis
MMMRPWKRRAIDHVICVSNAVATGNHIPLGPDASVLPNFVLDEIVLSRTDDLVSRQTESMPPELPDEYLLFVGDMSEEKGLLTLLKAYESLTRKRPPLLIIGRRMPDTPVELPEGVVMCTEWSHDHVLAAFRRCLFAVLPSIWPDPCPTTVLEAMASGRPVVTTATGGIVDMVIDGESGLLVSPGDEYRLAEAMSRLLNDADLRARLAVHALERVQRFTASAVVERLEAVYRQVAPQNLKASWEARQITLKSEKLVERDGQ